MKTERNQLASVGRLRIWRLPDAALEEEVFQAECIHRHGISMPLLGEETSSFHSTTALTVGFAEDRGPDVSFVRARQIAKASATICNSLHKSDVGHRL